MSPVFRAPLVIAWAGLACLTVGCNMVPKQHLLQSQTRSRQLYDQNRALAQDRELQTRNAGQLAVENQRLQRENQELLARGNSLQQRVDNLLAERGKLQSQFTSLKTNPLSDATNEQFRLLQQKYPEFNFDPTTGVSKFPSDVLFESGSDEVRPQAIPLMRDFAKILGSGDAQQLNILVVGHTDDRRVVKPTTKAKHPDNWYLSAHRAINVSRALAQAGIKEGRMGVAGYGPHQPLNPNMDEKSRQRNRRVEIFVLAPNASLAGVDTPTRQ